MRGLMKLADKQKLCHQCDGRIPLEAPICPYCASDQTPGLNKGSQEGPLFKSQSLQDSLASLYTPPYSIKNLSTPPVEEKKEIAAAPSLSPYKEVKSPQVSSSHGLPLTAETSEQKAEQNGMWSLIFTMGGGTLLLLGLLQLFLSEGGTVRLEWDSSWWFVYCLLSAPFLFFGIKKIRELK